MNKKNLFIRVVQENHHFWQLIIASSADRSFCVDSVDILKECICFLTGSYNIYNITQQDINVLVLHKDWHIVKRVFRSLSIINILGELESYRPSLNRNVHLINLYQTDLLNYKITAHDDVFGKNIFKYIHINKSALDGVYYCPTLVGITPKKINPERVFQNIFTTQFVMEIWGNIIDWRYFVIAGGSIVSCVVHRVELSKQSDVDIFCINTTFSHFVEMVGQYIGRFYSTKGLSVESDRKLNNVYNIKLKIRSSLVDSPVVKLQFIYKGAYHTTYSIINQFDLSVVQVAYDPHNGIIYGTLSFINYLRTGYARNYKSGCYKEASSEKRMIKYIKRFVNKWVIDIHKVNNDVIRRLNEIDKTALCDLYYQRKIENGTLLMSLNIDKYFTCEQIVVYVLGLMDGVMME